MSEIYLAVIHANVDKIIMVDKFISCKQKKNLLLLHSVQMRLLVTHVTVHVDEHLFGFLGGFHTANILFAE